MARDPALTEALAAAGRKDDAHTVIGPPGMAPLLTAILAAPELGDHAVLAVTATTRDAEDLAAELRGFLAPTSVVEFPAWETLPHERLSPTHDTVGRRDRKSVV